MEIRYIFFISSNLLKQLMLSMTFYKTIHLHRDRNQLEYHLSNSTFFSICSWLGISRKGDKSAERIKRNKAISWHPIGLYEIHIESLTPYMYTSLKNTIRKTDLVEDRKIRKTKNDWHPIWQWDNVRAPDIYGISQTVR